MPKKSLNIKDSNDVFEKDIVLSANKGKPGLEINEIQKEFLR